MHTVTIIVDIENSDWEIWLVDGQKVYEGHSPSRHDIITMMLKMGADVAEYGLYLEELCWMNEEFWADYNFKDEDKIW